MAWYSGGIDINKFDLRLTEKNCRVYDDARSESSAQLPLNSCVYMCSTNGSGYRHYSFPEQDSGLTAVVESVPVGWDLQTLCEDQGRRKKDIARDKAIPAHVLAHRRAQNRASQQAFRDRKSKQKKELEEGFAKLARQHSDLLQAYKSLQLKYSALNQELESLRREYPKQKSSMPSKNHSIGMGECGVSQAIVLDPLPFDDFTNYL